MTNEALQNLIGSWFPNPKADAVSNDHVLSTEETIDSEEEKQKEEQPINTSLLDFTEKDTQFLNISVQPEQLHSLMTQLKNHTDTSFDYLFCLTGMDHGKELGVVYHLESTKNRHIVVVKVKTEERDSPTFDSVCDIWATADFLEREVYDFFGIKFNNHPNLKRLFLTDEWEGFPLRKDYVDEINMVIK